MTPVGDTGPGLGGAIDIDRVAGLRVGDGVV